MCQNETRKRYFSCAMIVGRMLKMIVVVGLFRWLVGSVRLAKDMSRESKWCCATQAKLLAYGEWGEEGESLKLKR